MEKGLKIAIVLPSIITKNGTAKQSLELGRELLKRGNKVEFVTYAYLKNGSFEEFADFKINFFSNVEKSPLFMLTKNLATLEKLYLYIALLRIQRLRQLLGKDKYNIINPHDWFGMWVAAGVPGTHILVVNINDVPNRENGGVISNIKLMLDRKFSKKVKAFIVLDNQNAKKITKWLSVSVSKVRIVRSGIDANKFRGFNESIDFQKKFGFKKGSLVFACANLLARNRKYEEVIEAIYKIKKIYQLTFYVLILSKLDFDRDYAKYLRELVRKKKLESQVMFIDKYFSNEERMAYIRSCSALVFSNSPQTWGLTVLEAMALGTPAIVSSGSGVSEVLSDNKDSYIYKSGNIGDLTKKMLKIYYSKQSNKISENAKKYVLKEFTWENYAVKIEELFCKLLLVMP